jgi:hypothetical protein
MTADRCAVHEGASQADGRRAAGQGRGTEAAPRRRQHPVSAAKNAIESAHLPHRAELDRPGVQRITHNRASGGEGEGGGAGLGLGVGAYDPAGLDFDALSVIKNNEASTSGDDIFV